MNDTDPNTTSPRHEKRTVVHPWFDLAERQSHALGRLLAVNAGYARYVVHVAGVVGRAAFEQADLVRKAARNWAPSAHNGSPPAVSPVLSPSVLKPVKPAPKPDPVETEPERTPDVAEPEMAEAEVAEPEAEIVEPEPEPEPEPEVTEPEAAESAVFEPEVTEPEAAEAEIVEPEVVPPPPPAADDDDVDKARLAARERYVGKRKADLVKEAADRGLPKYGTVAQLLDRLVSDDTR